LPQKLFDEIETLIPVKEVARLLHVSPNTVRRWSDRGIIRTIRINHRGDRRYMVEDIYLLIEQLQIHNYDYRKIKLDKK
jgi:DNA-binding transcriptional MerR regulator